MSEEKPTFKVTDRRLFNPDGTPRDIEREAEAAADSNASTTTTAAAATAATSDTGASGAETAEARSPVSPSPAETERSESLPPPQQQSSQTGTANEPRLQQPAPPDAADDPTAFANLVMFIASPAAAAMGMTEHPGLAPGELDLPLAKHCIDLLGTIQQKTRGNLGAQESQILEGLLAELRMQYISLTSTQRPPAARPRGFTGGDITGGR